MQIEHMLDARLLQRPIKILVVGAGGTGSAFLTQLPFLHQALLAWGHPYGLQVTVMDGDVVSETNCVRQSFSRADVGQNKATVMVGCINLFYGLDWDAIPSYFSKDQYLGQRERYDFVVGCVDTRAARREITAAVTHRDDNTSYYLDMGNNSTSGQYILGQPANRSNRQIKNRLPIVSELFPEVLAEGEDSQPSCSAAEAINSQEPYVNPMLAIASLSMLKNLLRHGKISFQGGFWNAIDGRMTPVLVDTDRCQKSKRAPRRKCTAKSRKAA
jgi:PRTRC genetic system ThiF family protein